MKKKKSNLNMLLQFLAIVFSVVAICMMFVESVRVVGYSSTRYGYTGFQATFGYTAKDSSISELAFSFMNLLPYVFLVFSIVLLVLSLLGNLKGKFGGYIICTLLAVAGILFLLEGVFTVYGDLFNNAITSWISSNSSAKITTELSTGAIVAGVSSFVAALCELLSFSLNKKSKSRKK